MQALVGAKKSQSQKFLENGMRIPVTLIDVKDNRVIAVMTQDKNKYQAIQLGFGIRKHASRAQVGHAKGAKLEKAPKFLREVRILADDVLPAVGDILNPSEVFQPGDIVNVSGISKGKGFAGVVKRHGFHGGPKTHGQSDRHRAPGAIGQGTTPGRVYKGKRMAGRMGSDNVTVRNLKIIDVTADGVLVIKGLVPGIINSLIVINKVGTDKKFVPLWKEVVEEEVAMEEIPAEETSAEKQSASVQTPPSDDAQTAGEEDSSSEPVQQVEVAEVGDSTEKVEESNEASSETPVETVKEETKTEELKEEVKEDANK